MNAFVGLGMQQHWWAFQFIVLPKCAFFPNFHCPLPNHIMWYWNAKGQHNIVISFEWLIMTSWKF